MKSRVQGDAASGRPRPCPLPRQPLPILAFCRKTVPLFKRPGGPQKDANVGDHAERTTGPTPLIFYRLSTVTKSGVPPVLRFLTTVPHWRVGNFFLEIYAMSQGTVKWFNPTKGYGFIQPQDGGKDVFVHISAVERAGLSTLNEGQNVQYELVENRGKSSAENLKVK